MLKKKAMAITATLVLVACALFISVETIPPHEEAAAAPPRAVVMDKMPKPQKEIEPPATAAEPERELLSPSGLTAAELEAGLLEGLKPFAEDFIAAERETGVNAVFLAAVAALESGWNTSAVAESKHNLFGWSAATGYKRFSSKKDCIAEVATSIKSLYLSPDGEYFNGYTVAAVNIRYNGNEQWENTVAQIMREINRRIERSGNNVE